MSCEPKKIPRPVMSGLLHRRIKQTLAMTFAVTAAGALTFYFMYIGPRHKRFAEYYRKFDIDAEFNKIMETGAFDSCKPGGVAAKKK